MHAIQKTFERIYGHHCWDVNANLGLSMQFGRPGISVLNSKRPGNYLLKRHRTVYVYSEWKVVTWESLWEIKYQDQILMTDEWAEDKNNEKKLRNVLIDLNGQKLINFSMNHKNGETCLYFDLGFSIRIYQSCRIRKRRELLWIAKRSGYYLQIYSDGTYSHSPGSSLDNRQGVYDRPIPYDFNLR